MLERYLFRLVACWNDHGTQKTRRYRVELDTWKQTRGAAFPQKCFQESGEMNELSLGQQEASREKNPAGNVCRQRG